MSLATPDLYVWGFGLVSVVSCPWRRSIASLLVPPRTGEEERKTVCYARGTRNNEFRTGFIKIYIAHTLPYVGTSYSLCILNSFLHTACERSREGQLTYRTRNLLCGERTNKSVLEDGNGLMASACGRVLGLQGRVDGRTR